MLGIEYPVFQGGMAWIADGKLAAAVSEGGGLGIIAAGNAPGDYVREQIHISRSLTDKPIGVNIMLLSPFAEEVAKVVLEEKVEVLTTGAGNPSRFIQEGLAAGIKVACDLYNYLSGKEEYAQLFKGSYLTNYSWGETTLGELLSHQK